MGITMAGELLRIKTLVDGEINGVALNTVATGDETTTAIDSEGGVLPSVRKVYAEFATVFGDTAANAAASAESADRAAAIGLIQPGVYATETAGRAAVGDGAAFKVTGAGSVAAYEYRRIDASTPSALISLYPSVEATFTASRELARVLPYNIFPLGYSLQGKYINAGTRIFQDAASVVSAIVPVSPGATYRIISSSFADSGLALSYTSSPVPIAGQVLTVLTPVAGSSPGERLVTIPDVAGARYIAFNLYLPGIAFDIRSGFEIIPAGTDNLLTSDPVEFKSFAAGNGLAFADAFTDGSEIGDLIPANLVSGWYVNANSTVPAYGNLVGPGISGAIMYFFPVAPGVAYKISAASTWPTLGSGLQAVALRATAHDGTTPTLGVAPLEADTATSRILRIPADSPARFAFLNVKVATLDISATLRIEAVGEIGAYAGVRLIDTVAREALASLSNATAGARRLKGKRWTVIGDSITEKNMRANKNYHDFVSDAVGGIIVDNKGLSGTSYCERFAIADLITTTPDAITVFLGTNDWDGVRAAAGVPLGAFGDSGTTTVAGCINTLLQGLLNKFPTVPIGVATPTPRANCWGEVGTANSRGYTLRQLSDLIIRYARHFSMPYIDLYAESSLPVQIAAGNAYYFTAPGSTVPDGLHLNDAGQAVAARKFMALLDHM